MRELWKETLYSAFLVTDSLPYPSLTKLQFASLSYSLASRITKTDLSDRACKYLYKTSFTKGFQHVLLFMWGVWKGVFDYIPKRCSPISFQCYVYPRKREFTQTFTFLRKMRMYICDLLRVLFIINWHRTTGCTTFGFNGKYSASRFGAAYSGLRVS